MAVRYPRTSAEKMILCYK